MTVCKIIEGLLAGQPFTISYRNENDCAAEMYDEDGDFVTRIPADMMEALHEMLPEQCLVVLKGIYSIVRIGQRDGYNRGERNGRQAVIDNTREIFGIDRLLNSLTAIENSLVRGGGR